VAQRRGVGAATIACSPGAGGDGVELTVVDHIDVPELRLYCISDVHLGSPDCDEDLFLHDLEVIKNDDAARLILNGDLLQYDTKKSRGDVYRQKYPPGQQKRLMRQFLKPVKDRILGMVGGNHDEGRTDEDATPIQDIAEWLGVPYCEGEALFRIAVGSKRKNGKPAVYTLYCTHGWTGSRFIGGKALNLHRLSEIVLADVYVISHTHQQMAFPDSYYVPDLRNNNVMQVTRYYVNTGSYQRRGQYPIRKGLRPAVLGTPQIALSGAEKKVEVRL